MSDRTVHARYTADDGTTVEIVRYDRAGSWYQETAEGKRRGGRLTVGQAAMLARWGRVHGHGSTVFGLHGGGTFDRLAG